MIPMPPLSSPDVFTQLDHLARRFAHWRQNRPRPKARIPNELWNEAVFLTAHLSVSRVAKHLGLCTADLKKHCPTSPAPPSSRRDGPPIHFVDVTPTSFCPPPVVEVNLKRADGTHLHLAYHHGTPALRDLVRAFLEAL
jgi:hypothetical protein